MNDDIVRQATSGAEKDATKDVQPLAEERRDRLKEAARDPKAHGFDAVADAADKAANPPLIR